MRHRQAVRQGTLTPPSQVRLLLAQLETAALPSGRTAVFLLQEPQKRIPPQSPGEGLLL